MRTALTVGALAVAAVSAVSVLLPDGEGAAAPPTSIDLGVRTPAAGAPALPAVVPAPTDVPKAAVPAPEPAPVPAPLEVPQAVVPAPEPAPVPADGGVDEPDDDEPDDDEPDDDEPDDD